MRNGYSLVELSLALLIVGLIGSTVAPSAAAWRDAAAARAAREVVVEAIALARAASLGNGRAAVELELPSTVRVVSGDSAISVRQLDHLFGASMSWSGAQPETRLAFDVLGIGRMANRSITFRVGNVDVGLVVSGFGRARRQ